MVALLPLVLLATATYATANPLARANIARCGTEISPQEVLEAEKVFESLKASSPAPQSQADVELKVYWNVIYSANGGNIDDSVITQQIAVLNEDYKTVGVSWKLEGVNRVQNDKWADTIDPASSAQTEMKNALRQGGADDLNVYSVNNITKGILGYATFPWSYQANKKDDGVVLRASTLPGNPPPYGKGKTLTHEAGHWVGLYHTFQNGCQSPGDYVDDTPYEASPAYGCPEGRDTCPAAPGLDPIHNFMDYSDDACLTEFTPGQGKRLNDALVQFRIGKT